MSTTVLERPTASEYNPFYETYVSKVPDADIFQTLRAQSRDLTTLLSGLDEARASHRYAEGKWSIKEVLGHLMDSERVFAYRALRFARGDRTDLPGFEQNDFIRGGKFDARTMTSLLNEYEKVRAATLALFESLDGEALRRMGTANGSPVSARALLWIIAGHEKHHTGILRSRYL